MQKHYNTKCIIVLGSDAKFCIDIGFARMKSKVFMSQKIIEDYRCYVV